jgi:hypothetical protein
MGTNVRNSSFASVKCWGWGLWKSRGNNRGSRDCDATASVLDGVLILLSSPDCDVAWSSFDTPEEVIEQMTYPVKMCASQYSHT